ncbi:PLP-dependent aminotransferase family protein [Sporolactobacillus nakayamae]|uniref:GntR family transcriptional regulator / MocR family aminotransferase n=1 Tax=Sporolactobacillus nakayamae TaxID=269670 RepID=A0A1I2TKP2_9BACL|nr:PLP-dependent aminotransferase family protein [Sporolactobacillus nakayamae]SFG65438.1 GntR family transcriptional regulator / MocR family aminotransferase [Sporolactobacillus nakayamae]
MEIVPELDERLKDPLYIQLYRYFKQEIEEAILHKEMRLPSIRYLADRLKVSKTTVQMAYQQLLAEGYIESRARSGYFVAELSNTFSETSVTDHPPRMHEAAPLQKKWPISFDFFMSDIDTAHFPLDAWQKCERKLLNNTNRDVLKYGDFQGERRLREELSDYLHRSRGVHCRPEQIVIAAGTQSVLDLLYHLIDWKNQRLAMEDPGYQGVHRSLQGKKIQLAPISVEEDGLSVDELNKIQADAVYITPSHQYPLGMVMPIAKRMKLLSWANEHNGWVIEDDYDGEFRYRGKPIPALQGIDEHNRVIYIGTFSKSLMPAIRVSYMVLPPALLETYQRLEWRQTASRLHQQTLALFIENGQWEQHIRKMRTIYKKKQALLLETIRTEMGRHVRVSGQDAGLHIAIHVKSKCPSRTLIKQAKKAGIRVYETSAYLVQNKDMTYSSILLGFGGLSPDEIRQGIKLLHKTWLPYYS